MNRTKKIALVILSVTLIATILIGGSLAYFTDVDEVENVITMGHVQISLNEPEFEEATTSENVVTYRMADVLPTQTIDKDPTITVEKGSEDCYLRISIVVEGFEGLSENAKKTSNQYCTELEELLEVKLDDSTTVSLNNINSGWLKSGNYYYYQNGKEGMDSKEGVCSAGDVIPVFSQFTIPKNWGSDVAGQEFKISIYAEAVQASYFTPTRDSNNNIIAWKYDDGTYIIPEKY